MTRIVVSGADASASLDYSMPFDGVTYLNFFTSSDVMLRNLVADGPASVAVGTPTVTSGKLDATGRTHYVKTGVSQTAAGTLIAAARCLDDASTTALTPKLISNYSGGTLSGGGAALAPRNASSMSGLLALDNSGAYQAHWTDLADDFTEWSIWAFRWSAGATRVDNLTADTSITGAPANPVSPSTNLFCIGSDVLTGGTTFLGRSEIASACIVSRSITDDELAEMARRMRVVAARSGITV